MDKGPTCVDNVSLAPFATRMVGRDALRQVHAKMCSDPVGSRILAERPSVRSDQIDIEYLRALPKHTFGYAYSQFMDSHGYGGCCILQAS